MGKNSVRIILCFLIGLIFFINPAWAIIENHPSNNISTDAINDRLSDTLTFEGKLSLPQKDLHSRGIIISADGSHAYATSFLSLEQASLGGYISWYHIDSKNGSLVYQDSIETKHDVPTGIVISPNRQYAYATTIQGYIHQYKVNPDGSLTYIDKFLHTTLDRQEGITISPDGKYVYTAVINSNAIPGNEGHIDYFKVSQDGSLEFQNSQGTEFEKSVCMSPDGKYLYSSSADGYISWYSVNTDGSLSYKDHARSQIAETHWVVNIGISMARNGKYIITLENLGMGTDTILRLWKTNPTDGSVTDLGIVSPQSEAKLRGVAIAPNGKYTYATAIGEIDWFSDKAT